MRKKGVYFVTTSLPRFIWKQMYLSPWWKGNDQWFEDFFQHNTVNILRTAYQENVRVAFGSDISIELEDQDRGKAALRFIEVFLEAGASPLQILQAMAVNAAEAIDVYDKHGKIEKGYVADIIAVKGNPLNNIHTL